MSRELKKHQIKYFFIHCAATPNGKRFIPAQIDQWHNERGFNRAPEFVEQYAPTMPHIGYHYVIELSGKLVCCRHETETGAHAFGYNSKSLSVCLIGTDKYTHAQWFRLKALIERYERTHPGIQVVGHNQFSEKTCPGFDVPQWLSLDKPALAGHILEGK